jgi:nitroreductase
MPQPSSRLQARYGQESIPAEIALNPLIEHLLDHRSVRAYLPDPVTDARARRDRRRRAIGSELVQPQRVERGRGARRRAPRRLAELAGNQAHVREAPLQLVWLADLARLRRIATGLGRPAEGLDYLEMFLTGVIDAALAAQNGAAAAESLGLGMVYIGGMRNHPEEVAELLGLPPGVFAVFGMCVGRPDPARPADIKPRPPQAVVLHHERYSLEAQDEGIAAYDRAMVRFYAEQKMNVHGTWSVHSSKRIAGPETLSGRHRLIEALNALGFALK